MEVAVRGLVTMPSAWASISETDVMLRLAGAPPIRSRWLEDADGEIVRAERCWGRSACGIRSKRNRFVG